MKNWNDWYKETKESLVNDFGLFIKELKVGDMDLNTYCKYR